MGKDIRNTEITIKVKADECSFDAIKRYMKRRAFTYYEEPRKAGLVFQGWYNSNYDSLWVSTYSYNEKTEKVTFELNGNKLGVL